MSENTPDRIIGGLSKRGKSQDLSGMLARNRPVEAPTPSSPVEDKPSTDTGRATDAPQAPKKASAKKAPARKASNAADTGKAQVTVYLSHEVRNRARAAFKATDHLEGDRNWSAFIEEAVLAETQRREQKYNDGNEYPGSEEALSPGRRIS